MSVFRVGKCHCCGQSVRVVDGAYLRRLRESAQLPLREVARRLGFSAAYISDIELNRRGCSTKIFEAYHRMFKQHVDKAAMPGWRLEGHYFVPDTASR